MKLEIRFFSCSSHITSSAPMRGSFSCETAQPQTVSSTGESSRGQHRSRELNTSKEWILVYLKNLISSTPSYKCLYSHRCCSLSRVRLCNPNKTITKDKIKQRHTFTPFTYLQEPLLEMFKTVPPMQSLISLDSVLDWRFTDTGTLEQHNGSLPQHITAINITLLKSGHCWETYFFLL